MCTPVKVWTRFTKVCDGKEIKLRIQELPEDRFGDMFEFLFKYFVPDEALHKASKVAKSAEALEEYKQVFSMLAKEMNYQVDVCCLDDDSDELRIVGISNMVLEKRGESCDDLEIVKRMVQTEEIKTLMNLSTVMNNKCNVFEKFNLDACYIGRGVVVHKDYRGLGIAKGLLQVRWLVCQERGVPITDAWMTAIGSQKAAAKLGWETICELDYGLLGKETGVEFDGETPSCKLMVKRVST